MGTALLIEYRELTANYSLSSMEKFQVFFYSFLTFSSLFFLINKYIKGKKTNPCRSIQCNEKFKCSILHTCPFTTTWITLFHVYR